MSKPVSPYVMFVWENKGTKIKPEMEESEKTTGQLGERATNRKITIEPKSST